MQKLRILVAEDSEDDFALLVRALVRCGYEVEAVRVEAADTMRAALASGPLDLIFSDWSIPKFGAREALALVRDSGLDVPFIIVSGTIGEEVAIEALHTGAHDFLVKGRLARLGPAVERELREVAARREHNAMREQLMISDRMASVGILAAGLAHEINNPLAAVMANLEMAAADVDTLVSQLGQSDLVIGLRDGLGDARAASERIRTIVRDLKVFSRTEVDERTPIDVHKVIESTLRMASNEVRHRAKLVTDYASVPLVFATEARVGQVLLNLIVNAAQAIPEGNADRNQIAIKTRVDGSYARIEIADTGPGIPPEIMKQLFTPFVTTKPIGAGTGLGLSICHRIVTELGGTITVETDHGKGTVFVVRLPLAPAAMETPTISKVNDGVQTRRGSILIADDDSMIVTVLRRVLKRDHDVTCVDRAGEAIELIARGERFDVIVSDLMMPEVTGMDLHAKLLEIAPDQATAIVFLTGGTFSTRAYDFLDQVSNLRIEKPFDPVELRGLINSLIK